MTEFLTKSSKTFSPRCQNIMSLKKDIRVGLKKKQGQKNGGRRSPTGGFRRSKSITPRDSCGNTQKTSIRRRPSKIEASCFCFLRRYDSGVEEQRPPPYNPDF